MRRIAGVAAFLLVLLVLVPVDAVAIPAFARRYKVSCQLCHNPVPKLTAFGITFAGNGYRMAAKEPPRDTIDTGDPLLNLASSLPIAIRLDGYAQAFSKGNASTDFQAPYIIKLLASGPLSKTFSYYMYVNLLERGEFGGFEDAMLIANDIFNAPVDIAVGQFQVSDVLFKRELRLMFEDYAIYRVNVGDEPVNLTYDRGVMASADVLGFTLTGQLLNGSGIGPALSDRRFDDNGFKNMAGGITRDITGFLRLGVFGYYGKNRSEEVENKLTIFGGDATVVAGPVEINGQFIHREDSNPLFQASPHRVKTDGGFVEAVLRPSGSRWHGYALYNRVSATDPVLNVRAGTGSDASLYQSITGGAGYLVMRNLKFTGEGTWLTEQETMRWSIGFVTAF